MSDRSLNLELLDDRLAVCRLSAHESIPVWVMQGPFYSLTRTPDELSIVCREESIPQGIKTEGGWRALRVIGEMDLTVVGVLASLTSPIAAAGISLFAVSTFDTDYLLIKEHDLGRAVEALRADGHVVHDI